MAIHPHDTDCVYIVTAESDEFRCTPEGLNGPPYGCALQILDIN